MCVRQASELERECAELRAAVAELSFIKQQHSDELLSLEARLRCAAVPCLRCRGPAVHLVRHCLVLLCAAEAVPLAAVRGTGNRTKGTDNRI